MDKDRFNEASGKLWFRKGSKPKWLELEVRQADGSVRRLIAREVKEFWSEKEEVRL